MPSAVCRPSSAIYRLLSAICHLPPTVCRPLYAFCCLSHLPSAACHVYRLLCAFCHAPSAVCRVYRHHLLSAVCCMPSVVCCMPSVSSAICCVPSAACYRCLSSAVCCLRGAAGVSCPVCCLQFTVCCLHRCLYRPPHRYFCALHPTPPHHHTTRRLLSGKKAHPQLAGGLFSADAWPALFRFIRLRSGSAAGSLGVFDDQRVGRIRNQRHAQRLGLSVGCKQVQDPTAL